MQISFLSPPILLMSISTRKLFNPKILMRKRKLESIPLFKFLMEASFKMFQLSYAISLKRVKVSFWEVMLKKKFKLTNWLISATLKYGLTLPSSILKSLGMPLLNLSSSLTLKSKLSIRLRLWMTTYKARPTLLQTELLLLTFLSHSCSSPFTKLLST